MGVERRYAADGQGGARDRSDRLYPGFSARRRRLGLYQQPARLTAVPRALSRAAQARLAACDGSGMSDGRLGHCGCRGTALRYLEERPPVSVFFIPMLSIAIEVAFAAVLLIAIGKTLRNTLRASSLLSS
jgi:hypothetical protein